VELEYYKQASWKKSTLAIFFLKKQLELKILTIDSNAFQTLVTVPTKNCATA